MATQEMTARTGNSGFLDSYFSITQRGSTVRQELLAGLTTFLAMVYSIIVVPNMLGAAGFEQGPVFVATCLIAAFGSLLMGPHRLYRVQSGTGSGTEHSGCPRRHLPDGCAVYPDQRHRRAPVDPG